MNSRWIIIRTFFGTKKALSTNIPLKLYIQLGPMGLNPYDCSVQFTPLTSFYITDITCYDGCSGKSFFTKYVHSDSTEA